MKYRIGQLVPDSNTWCIRDLDARFGAEAVVTHALMHLPEPVTMAGEVRMLEEYAPRAARELAASRPDVVLFACSSAAALLGAERADQLYKQLEDITGAPVIGINPAIHAALRAAGIKRVKVVAPYEVELTIKVVASLEDGGFVVTEALSMGIAENRLVAQVSAAEIADFACSTSAAGADGVFVACGNLRALDAQPTIRRRTGLPVVTANSAAIDALRDLMLAGGEVGRS